MAWELSWGKGSLGSVLMQNDKGLACSVVLSSALPMGIREHEGPGQMPNTQLLCEQP